MLIKFRIHVINIAFKENSFMTSLFAFNSFANEYPEQVRHLMMILMANSVGSF